MSLGTIVFGVGCIDGNKNDFYLTKIQILNKKGTHVREIGSS